jgi:hypothetical protein
MRDVVGQLMPGDHPAFTWLNYSNNVNIAAGLDWLRARWPIGSNK